MKRVLALFCLVCLFLGLVACTKAEVPFSRGTVSENRYDSEFAGLHLVAPHGFTFAEDATLASLMSMAEEHYSKIDTLRETLEKRSVLDAQLYDSATANNLLISFKKVKEDASLKTLVDEEAKNVIETYAKRYPNTKQVGNIEEVKLGNVDCLKFVVDCDGAVQGYYYFLAHGLLGSVCVTLVKEAPLSDYEAMFVAG